MNKAKRFTVYFLLLIFGFLSLKNLLFENTDEVNSNCQEFEHIHFFRSPQSHRLSGDINFFDKKSKQSNGDDDDSCHEGKSVLTYSPFPAAVFYQVTNKHKLIYDLVYTLENHFKSPDLEPHRKPPKVS